MLLLHLCRKQTESQLVSIADVEVGQAKPSCCAVRAG